jgi:hypothetical protein
MKKTLLFLAVLVISGTQSTDMHGMQMIRDIFSRVRFGGLFSKPIAKPVPQQQPLFELTSPVARVDISNVSDMSVDATGMTYNRSAILKDKRRQSDAQHEMMDDLQKKIKQMTDGLRAMDFVAGFEDRKSQNREILSRMLAANAEMQAYKETKVYIVGDSKIQKPKTEE